MRVIWVVIIFFASAGSAQAEFILSSEIIDFCKENPKQQDIEVINTGTDNDDIQAEIYEVQNPGTEKEEHIQVTNPELAGLSITPDKMELPAGAHKMLHLNVIKQADDKEHIYHVVVKPAIRVDSHPELAIKNVLGYEALVIIRPNDEVYKIESSRNGKKLALFNSGNTSVFLQGGKQCEKDELNCQNLEPARIYPGQKADVSLPYYTQARYYFWDGSKMNQKSF